MITYNFKVAPQKKYHWNKNEFQTKEVYATLIY